MFKQHNIITAIELGTSKICVLVGECVGDELLVIGRGEVESAGSVIKGEICKMDLALEHLIDALDQADEESGNEINNSALFVMSVTGCGIDSFLGAGTAFIRNDDQRIDENDIREALHNAQIKPLKPGQRKINLFDAYYMLDDARRVSNPLGLQADKLEAFSHVIHGDHNRLANFTAVAADAGLEDEPELMFAPLADACCVLSDDERENGVLLVDYGAGTTEYTVIYHGGVLASGVFAIGFDHVANDLSIGLNLPISYCRKILQDGTLKQLITQNQATFDCRTNSGAIRRIPVESFSKIIDARMQETFELIYRKLSGEPFWRNLSAGAVLTGGGALYFQTPDIFHRVCDLPSRIGKPYNINGASTDLDNPRYSTVYGALHYGFEQLQASESYRSNGAIVNSIADLGDAISRFFKSVRKASKF